MRPQKPRIAITHAGFKLGAIHVVSGLLGIISNTIMVLSFGQLSTNFVLWWLGVTYSARKNIK